MKYSMLQLLARAASIIGLTLAAAGAHAQADNYPVKPIKMIIGFAPGGPTDVVARVLAQRMTEKLGKQIVVDNRPGAGSNLAAGAMLKEAADGYSIFYNTSSITIAPHTYAKVAYDPIKDYAPVLLTAGTPLVLVVNPNVPARTMRELLDLLKASPGKFNYGSSGNGAIEHLTSAQLLSTYNLVASHVPYKGTAPALVDLIAGQTQFMSTTLNTALQHISAGRLVALAVTSKARVAVLPNVPTVSEALGTQFESSAWQGIVVPASTPAPIIRKLNETVNAILQEEGTRQNLAAQGVYTLGGTPEQYGAHIRSEYARWEKVVKATGARAD